MTHAGCICGRCQDCVEFIAEFSRLQTRVTELRHKLAAAPEWGKPVIQEALVAAEDLFARYQSAAREKAIRLRGAA